MSNLSDLAAADSPDAAHFAFGENWSRFLATLDDARIAAARQSMQQLLQCDDLRHCRFLDAGSGSGLFSLAAHQLGAEVTSFDVDPDCVACARSLQARFGSDAPAWNVRHGSLTDREFLGTLGEFDVVYCWGVAHHTGCLWTCIENLLPLVKPHGRIVLAIYNDQGYVSRIWSGVKGVYQRVPRFLRPAYVALIGSVGVVRRLVVDSLAACLRIVRLKNPLVPYRNWIRETRSRGMSGWHDLVDWVGGWPFEVAKPEEVFRFLRDRGFVLQELSTSGGHGCNEFVFLRSSGDGPPHRED